MAQIKTAVWSKLMFLLALLHSDGRAMRAKAKTSHRQKMAEKNSKLKLELLPKGILCCKQRASDRMH
jgi:hypothetical protein